MHRNNEAGRVYQRTKFTWLYNSISVAYKCSSIASSPIPTIDWSHKQFLLLVTFYSQNLHVARQVCATLGFLHCLILLLSSICFNQAHSLSFPDPMKNTPSESEHPYSEHVPQTSGQCVAIFPSLEQVNLSLFCAANSQE
mmetsp:Transcript_18191/g.27601  ORF Transcript_18191/g.27601 Transcript_18191/m.27601 type:complete len:140 (-) Transcript_18191:100-519(-)